MKTTDEILNSFEGLKKAVPRPFLAARVKSKMMQKQAVWDKVITTIARPVFAFATILLVLLINIAVFVKSNNSNNQSQTNGEEDMIASNYATGSIYNFENNFDDEK